MADLQHQVNSQEKIKEYTDLSPAKMASYKNVQVIVDKNESYLQNAETIERRLKMFSDIFPLFEDMIDDMQETIRGIDTLNEAAPLKMQERAEEYMRMIEDALNFQDAGDFYLFNGRDGREKNMTIEIIGNMTTDYTLNPLPTVVADPLYPPDVAANIPPYSHFNDYTTHLEDEYLTYKPYDLNIGQDQLFEMDVTPYEPFLQNLIYGLDVIRKAEGNDPTVPLQTSLDQAEQLLNASESQYHAELRSLESKRVFIDRKIDQITTENQIYQRFLEKNDTVEDLATVVTQMKSLQTQTELSYQLTSRVAELSFVYFL